MREWFNSHREKIYKKLFRIIFKTAVVPFTHGLNRDVMLYNMYICIIYRLYMYHIQIIYTYRGGCRIFFKGGDKSRLEVGNGGGEGGKFSDNIDFFLY